MKEKVIKESVMYLSEDLKNIDIIVECNELERPWIYNCTFLYFDRKDEEINVTINLN